MPCFAKMLHHHLPPWATVKQRLTLHKPPVPELGSNRTMTTDFKRSKPADFDVVIHCQEHHFYSDGVNSSADLELQRMNSLEDQIEYGVADTSGDNIVYMKQLDPRPA